MSKEHFIFYPPKSRELMSPVNVKACPRVEGSVTAHRLDNYEQ